MTETQICVDGQQNGCADALLPDHFEPALFAKTIEQLSLQLAPNRLRIRGRDYGELSHFRSPELQRTLRDSRELLDEIIGLFLDESESQIREMQDCMNTNNFDSLAKVAHTLKGSLGTLHAECARVSAQALEIAAMRRNREECRVNLERLEADLRDLHAVAHPRQKRALKDRKSFATLGFLEFKEKFYELFCSNGDRLRSQSGLR